MSDDGDVGERTERARQGYRTAATFLWRDRRVVALYALLLALPPLLVTLSAGEEGGVTPRLVASLVQELGALALVVRLAGTPLRRAAGAAGGRPPLLPLFLYGTGFWVVTKLPSAAWVLSDGRPTGGFPFALFAIGFFVSMTLFFYFVPVTLGVTAPRRVAAFAHGYTSYDWVLPFRAWVPPHSLLLLVQGLFFFAGPDAPSYAGAVVADVSGGFGLTIVAYLSAAFAVAYFPVVPGRPTVPYGDEHLRAARHAGPEGRDAAARIAPFLTLKSGFAVLLLGSLVWYAAAAKAWSSPPPVGLEVKSVEAGDGTVKVTVGVSPGPDGWGRFHPSQFQLASLRRTPYPPRGEDEPVPAPDVTVDGARLEGASPPPDDSRPVDVTLVFKTDRTAEATRKIEDLALWYQHYRVARLAFGPEKR